MGDFANIILIVIAFVVGLSTTKVLSLIGIAKANTKAELIVEEANQKANNIEKNAILDAKTFAHEKKVEVEKYIKERKKEASDLEALLVKKEQMIDKKEISIQGKLELLLERENSLLVKLADIDKKEDAIRQKTKEQNELLEKIAGFSQSEAKNELFKEVEASMTNEVISFIKEKEEEAKEKADVISKNIVANAIQRYSAEQGSERTVSVVPLPSEEMKGRIIGREGRNIRAIEAATGVDLIIDDTPEAITVSCFDPIRREIAVIALSTLISDGRIQPGRIEDAVTNARKEVEASIKKAGEDTIFELGLTNMNKEMVKLIGRLKYRTSYGQSALNHSKEVAYITGMMAAELGENVKLARRAGLLHDIGKAIDFEQEGSHVELGAKYAKKYGENAIVINGIETHHGNKPPVGIIPILVTAADALSAARPGARRETIENYIERLEKLEEITTSFEGVEKAFAIQAGREIRVIVSPDKIDDLGCYKLARDVKDKIEKELTYPGQIKVVVLRETRASETAK